MAQVPLPRRSFDVAIFVATRDEFDAVRDQGKWVHEESPSGSGGAWVHHLLTRDNHIVRLALRKLPDMGPEECVLDVSRFLSLHPCRVVAMVGVCAGAEGRKLAGGDIVIAGVVESISNAKVTVDPQGRRDFRKAGRRHEMKGDLLGSVGTFADKTWHQVAMDIAQKFKEHLELFARSALPSLHHGKDVVMGQVFHVLAYPNAITEIQAEVNRRIAAVDMESAALAYAADEAERTPWIVIKGVQDNATITKDDKYRRCAAWGSYRTLVGLVAEHLATYWPNKKFGVRNVSQRRMDAKAPNLVVDELHKRYQAGRFTQAKDAGTTAMMQWPFDSRIWAEYLKSLLRLSDYEDAADLIDVVDYYLQGDGGVQGGVSALVQYRIRRAEYYSRVGHREVARGALDQLRRELEDVLTTKREHKRNSASTRVQVRLKDLYVGLSEVYYLLGRIAIDEYRHRRYNRDLDGAFNDFCSALELARKLKEGKYWIFFGALMARYVRDNFYDEDLAKLTAQRIDAAASKEGQQTRPAPRIYRLRMLVLETAHTGDSAKLGALVEREKTELAGKLFLPEDFFRDFEQDCNLIYGQRFRERDAALSMIYDWASGVREWQQ